MIFRRPGGSLYEQIAAELREAVRSGQIGPGQPIPSERTLTQQYNVARETVRRAVALLYSEGLLVVRRGQGVYVREQHELADLTPPAGATVTARAPTTTEQAEYEIGDRTPVFQIEAADGSVTVYPADRWRLRLR